MSIRFAIFASGTGTNAMNILHAFKDSSSYQAAFVLSNNADALVISSAQSQGVETIVCNNEEAGKSQFLIEICEKRGVSHVILAGYLRKIPADFVEHFANKIINIHPSLLPKYGGKGMFGHHVHEAVLADHQSESGISIHLVNNEYDQGKILGQFKCPVLPTDDPKSLQQKIHKLELRHFPEVIEQFFNQ